MKFGEKLKAARLKTELTQETVANQIGVSRQSLSNWENDRTYPDLASVLKLSDLYGVSLDDLMRHDMELRRRMEQKREQVKNLGGWLHDFALLLIGSTVLLVWLERITLSIVLGMIGMALICAVHLLFVIRLGSEWKSMTLRCLSIGMWFSGYMLRILSHHSNALGDALWYGGLLLYWIGSSRLQWNNRFPRRATAFTGFVFAMVLVFGTIPLVGDTIEYGGHVPGNPFTGQDYRITQVLAGEGEPIAMVYLGSTTSVYLDYPGQEEQRLEGKFTYITQPEGSKTKGVWEMLNGETLYRVTLEEDDRVTLGCQENGKILWAYELEPAPTMGCTILDVLGSVVASVDWYYAGSFDGIESAGSLHLRGKGTIKLSVPGTEPTVTIYEEFWDGNTVEHQIMVLTKDSRGFVEFYRETRQDGGKQTGIYRIPYQDGEFVLVVNYIK